MIITIIFIKTQLYRFIDDYLTKNILGRITMAGDTYQVLYEDTSDLIRKDRIYSGPVNLKNYI